MARYLRRVSLIAYSFWTGGTFQREYTRGQPLKCLFQNNLYKCPVKNGWVPDLPDARDHMYAAPQRVLATLPSQVDLRPQCPPVVDQGQLGSCTANAIGNAHFFNQ